MDSRQKDFSFMVPCSQFSYVFIRLMIKKRLKMYMVQDTYAILVTLSFPSTKQNVPPVLNGDMMTHFY